MIKTADLTLISLSLVSILYFLAIGLILMRRGFQEWAVGLLVFYLVVYLYKHYIIHL